MKRVLITGANGLLGRNLCDKLSRLDLLTYGLTHTPKQCQVEGIEYLTVDLTLDWSENELPARVETVIHLAQSEKFRDFPESALDVFKVNIESTARLLDYAKRAGAERFIYASSGGIYGNGSHGFTENSPIVPPEQLGYYLGSKACGEILVQSYMPIFQVVVLRPFFMYGQGQNRNMLIPRLMDSISAGQPIYLQGEHGIYINPVHVKDASTAVSAALELNESAIFNIAGPDVLSIRKICEAMGEYLGKKPIFQQHTEKPNDLIADISWMRSKLHNPCQHLMESIADVTV